MLQRFDGVTFELPEWNNIQRCDNYDSCTRAEQTTTQFTTCN